MHTAFLGGAGLRRLWSTGRNKYPVIISVFSWQMQSWGCFSMLSVFCLMNLICMPYNICWIVASAACWHFFFGVACPPQLLECFALLPILILLFFFLIQKMMLKYTWGPRVILKICIRAIKALLLSFLLIFFSHPHVPKAFQALCQKSSLSERSTVNAPERDGWQGSVKSSVIALIWFDLSWSLDVVTFLQPIYLSKASACPRRRLMTALEGIIQGSNRVLEGKQILLTGIEEIFGWQESKGSGGFELVCSILRFVEKVTAAWCRVRVWCSRSHFKDSFSCICRICS